MRITEGMRYAEVLRNLGRIQSQHADASQQALTGVRIDRPSKDPSGAAELARIRASLSEHTRYKEAITMVRGDAELAESALAESSDLLSRAREIAMTGANGAISAEQRALMGQEVRGLRSELMHLANTKGTKGYIFAGSRTNLPPFGPSGAFVGDDVQQTIDIGSGAPVSVGASGARAFTATGGRDVLADLEALSLALESNDLAGITGSLDSLEAGQQQLHGERSRSGLLVGRLDTSTAVFDQFELDAGRRQQQVGGADPFEAYSKMTALSGALERSVAVSRQIFELTGIARF